MVSFSLLAGQFAEADIAKSLLHMISNDIGQVRWSTSLNVHVERYSGSLHSVRTGRQYKACCRENRKLKQSRWQRQERQKKNRFYEQNKSSALVSRYLVHFFDVYCTPTTRFIQDVDIRPWFFLSVFERNLDKVLKNSTPGKITYIWQIERV